MPGLIINGKEEQIVDLNIVNYRDDSKLKLVPGHSMRVRHTRWVRSIGLHNTKNLPTVVKSGKGPSKNIGEAVVRFWSTSPHPAGAHLIVDWDATIYCLADLFQDAAYHMSAMNEVSIGIEIYEDSRGVVYEDQLLAVALLVRWLCRHFGIQMQMPPVMDNREILRIKVGGEDFVGVCGHCHQYYAGKSHDPGFDIMRQLLATGFKEFNFAKSEDKTYWRVIQSKLRLNQDGIPGPKTRDALQARGFVCGLYDFKTEIS
jgi:hypothetical protein